MKPPYMVLSVFRTTTYTCFADWIDAGSETGTLIARLANKEYRSLFGEVVLLYFVTIPLLGTGVEGGIEIPTLHAFTAI